MCRMGHVRWLEGDSWATWGQDRPEGGKRNKPGTETSEQNSRALANARRLSQRPLIGVIALLCGGQDAYPRARNSCSMFLCLKIAHMYVDPPPHPVHTVSSLFSLFAQPIGSQREAAGLDG